MPHFPLERMPMIPLWSVIAGLAWLLYGYHAILFWVGLPIAIFLLLWWIDRKKRK